MQRTILILAIALLASATWAQVGTRAEDVVVDALLRGDVYVAPQVAGAVDEARLQRIAQRLRPFQVKFVVAPLRDRQTRDQWAQQLRRVLNIREGAVIVLVPRMEGIRGGVSASSGVIPPREIERLVQSRLAVFTGQGYTEGLEQLAAALRDHYVQERRGDTLGTVALIGIPAALVLGGVAWVLRRRAQEVARLRARLQEDRARVLEGIEYLDGYLDVLPEGDDASRAREHRQKAAELQAQAVAVMEKAKRPQDLWRAEHLLDRAQMSIEKAKKYILRAGGDTSIRVEEEETEPLATGAQVWIRPNDRTYACFFCSKPPTLGELQPVEVTIGEQTRKVWACTECAEQLRRGETPAMRVYRDGDRVRPWYEHPDYDPYRDYGRPYPGMDLLSWLLLANILMPPPIIIHQGGEASAGAEVPPADAGGGDFFGGLGWGDTPAPDAGGGDFFGGVWGNEPAPDAGGSDFFDSLFGGGWGGDVDVGGADFPDFGGDFSGDFGGGDVGGGDF